MIRLCLLFLLFAPLSAAHADPKPAAPRAYAAAQFYQTTTFALARNGGLAFSPDGRHVLISSDRSGAFNAYAQPLDGGAPVQLTSSTSNATYAVSYFPHDDRILFMADTGGNEQSHIFVRETDGRVTDLTPGDKVKAIVVGWSGDRRTLWILTNARDPAFFDLYAVDPAGYATRLVYRNPGMGLFAVSPDGRWAVLQKEASNADSDLYLADLAAGGEPRLISAHQGKVLHQVFTFTPDSRALIYATDQHGEFVQAWRYDIATGARTLVAPASGAGPAWDVSDVGFSPSGRYRYVTYNADGRTRLEVTDLTTGRRLPLKGVPQGDIADVRFDAAERSMALSVSSDTSPTDIYVVSPADGRAARLTHALNPEIREQDLVEARSIRFTAPDGVSIPAILYRPRGASARHPAPAVVWVHGGPGGQSRRGYSAQLQHLVNHGYAVLAVNNRGSDGYGKTFSHLDDRRHGEDDLDDVVAAGDWLRGQPWVAKGQVGVMGGSYGGYLTTAAMAFRPTAFQVGVDIFGPTNWLRTLKEIPAWWGSERDAIYAEQGDPTIDAERLRRTSPLLHANAIVRPMLVVQGANDPRVLKVESDELVAALKSRGVPVEYLVFPDEGHGFRRRANRIAASEAYIKFLDRYLRRRAEGARLN